MDSPTSSIEQPVALVTGAAKKVGRALALALAASGAHVAITYRDSADQAEKTVAEIAAMGVTARAYHCDVRSPRVSKNASLR